MDLALQNASSCETLHFCIGQMLGILLTVLSKIIPHLRDVGALRIAIFISQRRESGQVLTKHVSLETFTFLTIQSAIL